MTTEQILHGIEQDVIRACGWTKATATLEEGGKILRIKVEDSLGRKDTLLILNLESGHEIYGRVRHLCKLYSDSCFRELREAYIQSLTFVPMVVKMVNPFQLDA